jgi:hypothetical protein
LLMYGAYCKAVSRIGWIRDITDPTSSFQLLLRLSFFLLYLSSSCYIYPFCLIVTRTCVNLPTYV